MLKTKAREFARQFRYVPRVFRLVWAASRARTITWWILLLIQSLVPFFTVLATRAFVNNAIPIVANGFNPALLSTVAIPFGLLIFLMVGGNLVDSLADWVRVSQTELVRDYISNLIQVQASRLDLTYYEDPKFFDLIYRVREEARHRPLILLDNMGMLIRSIISTVSLGILLATYGWWLLPLLVASSVPALWAVMRFNRRLNRWRQASTTRERLAAYYDVLLTDRIPAPEMRAFNLSAHYSTVYKALRYQLRTERLRFWRSKVIIDQAVSLLALGVAGGVMAWMGWRVLMGTGTAGDLIALYQIFTNVQNALGGVSGRAGDIYQSVLFLEDLFVFLDLEPNLQVQGDRPVPPLKQEIRFENVSFSYPGSERNALNDFSITIPAGKVVALVGENGEGKTTLTKLISRFYDPNEGRILWDGIDLREFAAADLRRQITMQFQTPYYFPESAYRNIENGDLERHLTMEEVVTASHEASVYDIIMRLPQKYDTILGKWFGGEELSIGQWQRLALARTLVREASLVILDEPTSAMDAWAEAEWMHRIREVAQERTMIIITHRFTTAMQADLIMLMQNHRVVEQGTHAELLQQGGRYAESWNDQMREVKTPDA